MCVCLAVSEILDEDSDDEEKDGVNTISSLIQDEKFASHMEVIMIDVLMLLLL